MPGKKSKELFEEAKNVIPGGSMSNFKKDEDYVTTYMDHGVGARLYDIDGEEYIDYSLSYGPAILGHNNKALIEATSEQLKKFYSPDAAILEVEAAKKIVEHLPGIEKVRFACSGTEANYNALRAARAYTGKNKVLRFNGHYDGGLDDIMGGIVTDPENPTPVIGQHDYDLYSIMTNTDGRAKHAMEDMYMIEWNDLDAMTQLFEKDGDNIAAVIMEPVMVNISGCLPEPGYLEGVRELCTKHNVVLIFDEVLTGFRMGLGGAAEYFGVKPDISTLAKAIGGGFPVSAFGGKAEIMDTITRTDVVAGGTYNGHPISMAAVIATIKELEKDNGAAFERIKKLGNMLKEGIDALIEKYNSDLLLQGFPGAWSFTCSSERKVINHADSLRTCSMAKAAEFGGLLKKQGVLTSFRFCTSAAHTEQDVKEALVKIEVAIKQLEGK